MLSPRLIKQGSIMNSENSTFVAASGYSLRLTIITGLFAAVSAAMGFALIAIPNFEMITACIFLSGLLLGPFRGLLVGLLAELIFASLNPMGMSFLPLLTAQLLTMGLAGFAGGLSAGILTIQSKYKRRIMLGLMGFLITLNYDFWTTMSFPLSVGFDSKQTINTLKLGIPFAIPHLLGNTAIFAVLIPIVYDRVRKLIPAAIIILLSIVFFPATTVQAEDSFTPLQKTNILSDSLENEPLNIENPIYYSDSKSWMYIYHDDAGDVMNSFPGIYLYDLALLGQPLYLNGPLGHAEVELFGIPLKSHYFNLTDFNLLPPGYLESVSIYPSYHEGILSADGVISAKPEKYFYDIPYTRVDYRDGYYGLGVADFVMSQRIHENYGFMFGGRISEFNGRVGNAELHGTNLRGLFHWGFDSGTKADFVYLSNRNKAQIPLTATRRNLLRTDLFLNIEKPMGDQPLYSVLHYANTEEDFGGPLDPNEEGWDLKVHRSFQFGNFVIQPSQYFNWYRMRSGEGYYTNLAEETSSIGISNQISSRLSAFGAGSLTIGEYYLPGGSAGLNFKIDGYNALSLTAARSSQSPPPYTRTSYEDSDELFLPGTISWRVAPGYSIVRNKDLNPQTVSNLRFTGDLSYGEKIKVRPTLFFKQIDNPIILSPTAGVDSLLWQNGTLVQLPGAETQISLGRWNGFGMRIAYTYMDQELLQDFIPDSYGYIWLDYQNRAYQDQLFYTIGVHGRYIGERAGVIDNVYTKLGDDNVWGIRMTFNIGNFTLFYGNENVFSKEYALVPGYYMMHREEVWGVNWVFWN